MLEQPDVATLSCVYCSHKTVWSFQLDHHVQKQHRNVDAAKLYHAIVEPEKLEPYSCICCNFQSYYKLSRYEHCHDNIDNASVKPVNIENSQFYKEFEVYFCDSCKYKGHSSLAFIKHHESCRIFAEDPLAINLPSVGSQINGAINSTTSSGFQCDQCSYRGKNKFLLRRHMVQHAKAEDIKWFSCAECSFQTKHKANLRVHMFKHIPSEKIKWFSCPICAYRVKKNDNLKRHLRTHAAPADVVWFSCTECSYRGKQERYLREHMRAQHAAAGTIKWINCTKCSYRAKKQSKLTYHMLTHVAPEEVVWIKCSKCHQRLKSDRNLKTHMMLMHTRAEEMVWFECSQCSYRTKQKFHLKSHMARHK